MHTAIFLCFILTLTFGSFQLNAQTVSRRQQSVILIEPTIVIVELLHGNGIHKNEDKTVAITSAVLKSVMQKFNLVDTDIILVYPNFKLSDTLTRLHSGKIVRDIDYSNFIQVSVPNKDQVILLVQELNQLTDIVFSAYVKSRPIIPF